MNLKNRIQKWRGCLQKRDPIWCEQIIHPSKIRNNEPNPFNNSSLIEATFAPNVYQTYIINLRRPVTSEAHRLQFSVHTVASCFGTHPASRFPAVPDLKSDLLYWWVSAIKKILSQLWSVCENTVWINPHLTLFSDVLIWNLVNLWPCHVSEAPPSFPPEVTRDQNSFAFTN